MKPKSLVWQSAEFLNDKASDTQSLTLGFKRLKI